MRHLPGHNSSYKRDILLSYGRELDDLLEAESVLHRRLRRQGYDLLLQSSTCTTHLNFTTWNQWIRTRYLTGRQFTSTWAKSWRRPRRLLFAVAALGIPVVRLGNIQRQVRRNQSLEFFMRLLPILLPGLLMEYFGCASGFAAGPGDSIQKMKEYEFHRV